MTVPSSPRGLIIDLITPLKPSGDIDGPGLGRHLDRVLPHVQAVLLASPHMGEGLSLSPDQRADLLEKTIVVTRGKVPIMVWVTGETPEKTHETLFLLEKRSKSRKYRGTLFWVDTPLFYHSNRGLLQHYRELTSATESPWVLYNDPALIKGLSRPLKRSNLRTNILKDLVQIGSLLGLVHSGSLERAQNYSRAVRARPDFRIYDGEESYFLLYPSLSGVVSAGANLAPRTWQKITDSSLNLTGSRPEYPDHLRQIWEAGEYLKNLMVEYRHRPVPLVKAALAQMGIIESPATADRAEASEKEILSLTAMLKHPGDYS